MLGELDELSTSALTAKWLSNKYHCSRVTSTHTPCILMHNRGATWGLTYP